MSLSIHEYNNDIDIQPKYQEIKHQPEVKIKKLLKKDFK